MLFVVRPDAVRSVSWLLPFSFYFIKPSTPLHSTPKFNMTEISDTGRFRPKEEEIDYEAYPCYKQYGPRHGTVNIFTGK